MKRVLIGIASAMLVWNAAAYGWGFGGPVWPSDSLSIGTQFVTSSPHCGGGAHPECPFFVEPYTQRFLLHYVILTGKGDTNCNISAVINRGGQWTVVARLNFWGDITQYPSRLSWDNIVLTFPKPLRGEVGDTLGVAQQTTPGAGETCFAQAVFGLEYLN